MTERELRRELRQQTRYLRMLTSTVRSYLAWMDVEMKKPSTVERGTRIGKALNALESANDHARLFGLPRPVKRQRRGSGGASVNG